MEEAGDSCPAVARGTAEQGDEWRCDLCRWAEAGSSEVELLEWGEGSWAGGRRMCPFAMVSVAPQSEVLHWIRLSARSLGR